MDRTRGTARGVEGSAQARTPRPRADSDLDPDDKEDLWPNAPGSAAQPGRDGGRGDGGENGLRSGGGGYSPPPPNAPSVRRRRGVFRRLGRPRLGRKRRWAAVALAALIVLILLYQHLPARRRGHECEFVSVIEAYERDLARHSGLSPRHLKRSDRDEHYLSSTGHLVLNPHSTLHPIAQLLHRAEDRFSTLQSRQSRSLREATTEYQRRYARPPPRGFDKWWAFAKNHSVLLPDEYDRIDTDLAPFRALDPLELQRRQEEVQGWDEIFNIHVRGGKLNVDLHHGAMKWAGSMPRASDQASTIANFDEWLPDVSATFSVFDQPSLWVPWRARDAYADAAREGRLAPSDGEDAGGEEGYRVEFAQICSPHSVFGAEEREDAALVYDAREAGNVCSNPYIIPLHGLTLEPHGPGSNPTPHGRLLPLFSLAKTAVNSDILAIPMDQFGASANDTAWDAKLPRLAWRGSNTGMAMMSSSVNWRASHRIRLHLLANSPSDEPVSFLVPTEEGGWNRTTASGKEVAEEWFDISLAQKPIQCEEDDGTCHELEELGFAGYQGPDELLRNKFLLDVDGNGWSGRFRKLLASSSAVVKATAFAEWWQDWLVPWYHYIPAKLDYSDLATIMAFFAGPPGHPELAFDETARAIGHNGHCAAERMYRRKDVQSYMFRLLLEWARITGGGGDFDYDRWRREGGKEP